MSNKILVTLAAGVLFSAVAPRAVVAHEGKLDAYGCHYNEDRKNYHCHVGVFQGGSFESKIEMIRQLRLQFLNLGRPWPYDDIMEEDITTTQNRDN